MSANDIGTEIAKVVRPVVDAKAYDLRHAVSQDMKDSGMGHLDLKYFTGHSISGDIMATYTSLKIDEAMERYFDRIQPLLDAIEKRAIALGCIPHSSLTAAAKQAECSRVQPPIAEFGAHCQLTASWCTPGAHMVHSSECDLNR